MVSLNRLFGIFAVSSVIFELLFVILFSVYAENIYFAPLITIVLLVLLVDFFMGIDIMLKADGEFRYCKATKIIYYIFFAVPFLVYLIYMVYLFFVSSGSLENFTLIILFIGGAYILGLLITTYFFDVRWGRRKKIAFAIYHGLFGLIYYVGLILLFNSPTLFLTYR